MSKTSLQSFYFIENMFCVHVTKVPFDINLQLLLSDNKGIMLLSAITIEVFGSKMFDLSYALHAIFMTPLGFIIARSALHIASLYQS